MLDDIIEAGEVNRRHRPQVLSARQLEALAVYALGPSGRLAQQKVFTRSDVAVALGPLLFGFAPRELLRAVEAVCGHPDAVALLGVKTAREQAYAPACVIATEAAIALKVALQADRTGAPAVGVEAAEKAITAKEDQLGGRPLTDGQTAMIRSVVTSGRPVELIVGVAGSGKTTALDAARQAFEDSRLPGRGHLHLWPGRPHPGRRSRHRRVPHHRLPAVAVRPPTAPPRRPHRGRL